MAKIKVIKNEENPEPTSVLAEAIIKISDAMEYLEKTGLNENAIILLTIDACEPIGPKYQRRKPSKKEVKAIFRALRLLKSWYCRKIK